MPDRPETVSEMLNWILRNTTGVFLKFSPDDAEFGTVILEAVGPGGGWTYEARGVGVFSVVKPVFDRFWLNAQNN